MTFGRVQQPHFEERMKPGGAAGGLSCRCNALPIIGGEFRGDSTRRKCLMNNGLHTFAPRSCKNANLKLCCIPPTAAGGKEGR